MKIVYHPLMRESYDRTPAGASGRLETSVEILSKHPDYEFVEARPATEEEINRAHAPGHIEKVKRDYDSTREDRLYQVATLAAGGAIMTAEIAFQGEPAFGLIRPPGHHASHSSYWGFCYFNNIAVSLLHLKATGLIESAYILDFDLHTGDGNIDILGDEKGIIIHNPSGKGDDAFFADVKRELEAAPDVDIIVASAGFDQYEHCWGGNISTDAFKRIGRVMHEFAAERCEGRRYGLLEGGYNFEDLGKNVLAFCEGLRGK
ncbi:MAG: histone deacetylase family protein [Candidatus Thorarchaeota archaeon]|nr:histone deacetylase family protein [Candidatus Thorarchaeota archaeon]